MRPCALDKSGLSTGRVNPPSWIQGTRSKAAKLQREASSLSSMPSYGEPDGFRESAAEYLMPIFWLSDLRIRCEARVAPLAPFATQQVGEGGGGGVCPDS